MTRQISSITDLRNWVWERSHDATEEEIAATVNAIQFHDDRPAYGTDWTEFLANVLPENLCDLIQD